MTVLYLHPIFRRLRLPRQEAPPRRQPGLILIKVVLMMPLPARLSLKLIFFDSCYLSTYPRERSRGPYCFCTKVTLISLLVREYTDSFSFQCFLFYFTSSGARSQVIEISRKVWHAVEASPHSYSPLFYWCAGACSPPPCGPGGFPRYRAGLQPSGRYFWLSQLPQESGLID